MSEMMTMYAAAKIVNGWLEADGVAKKLPPQMFYGYAKKGYISSFENEAGKICTTEQDLATWYAEYRKPKAKKESVEIVPEDDGTVGEW